MTAVTLAGTISGLWVATLYLAWVAGVRKGLRMAYDSLRRAQEAMNRFRRVIRGEGKV